MLSIPRRGPFYVLLLILGFLLFVVALNITYGPANSAYLPLFTTACAIAALFTFLWVSFLLAYGSSEVGNTSILTRCDIHLTSFGLMSFLWLCLCPFLAINARNECNRHTTVCQPLFYCAIMGFLMSLLALCSAAIVAYSVTFAGLRYDKHVEYARERALERAIELELQARSSRPRTYNGQYIPLPILPTTTRPSPAYTTGRTRQVFSV